LNWGPEASLKWMNVLRRIDAKRIVIFGQTVVNMVDVILYGMRILLGRISVMSSFLMIVVMVVAKRVGQISTITVTT